MIGLLNYVPHLHGVVLIKYRMCLHVIIFG